MSFYKRRATRLDRGLLISDDSDIIYNFFLWGCGPTRAMASSFIRFLNHTQRRITVGRTPLDE